MQHLIILAYFLSFSSGLGGLTAVGVLYYKLRLPIIRHYLAFLILYTVSLMLTAAYFYIREILVYFNSDLSLIFTGTAYCLVALAYHSADLLIKELILDKERRLHGLIMRFAIVYCFGIGALAFLAFSAGEGGRTLKAGQSLSLIVSIAVLFYFALRAFQLSKREQHPELRKVFRLFGILLGGFLLISPLQYLLNHTDFQPYHPISLNFLFYLVWNILHIVHVVRYLAKNSGKTADVYSGDVPAAFVEKFGLTSREQEMIGLIERGLSNKEIASELGISFTTVRTHIYNLYQKTGVPSRVGLLNEVRKVENTSAHTKV